VKYEWLNPNMISDQDIDDINDLLLQLTKTPRLVSHEKAEEVAGNSLWLVVRNDEGRIKGMNTMTISDIPTGKVAHLDDVVVDQSLRGQKIGEVLVQLLVDRVMLNGMADRIELTCKPSREAANCLYQKLGFTRRDTNCYIKKF
jgi:ribosomal protein S18 acetylase RimI-like enzyme